MEESGNGLPCHTKVFCIEHLVTCCKAGFEQDTFRA